MVTREQGWAAFRRTREGRLREREHAHPLGMDGQSCGAMAPWRYRDEERMRPWGQARHEAGRPGLERTPRPGRPT
jgi:hypothetical protein